MNWPENQATAAELRWGPVDQHQDDRREDRQRALHAARRRTVASVNHGPFSHSPASGEVMRTGVFRFVPRRNWLRAERDLGVEGA